MLSRLLISFLPRSKCLLISCLQSPSTVILEPPKIKSDTVSTASPSISHEVMGPDAMILVFWMLSFKPAFPFFFSPSSRGSFVSLHFLPLEWYLHIWGYWYFSWRSWFQLVLHPAWYFAWCIGEGNGNPLQCSCLENPREGEPGGLPSMGSHRVGHNWSDLAAAAALHRS